VAFLLDATISCEIKIVISFSGLVLITLNSEHGSRRLRRILCRHDTHICILLRASRTDYRGRGLREGVTDCYCQQQAKPV